METYILFFTNKIITVQPYAPIWRSRGCLKTNRRSEEPERQRGYLLEFPAGNSRRLLPPGQVRGRKNE